MKEYIYPANLKSQPKLWLWKLRDIAIIGVGFLLSVFALAQGGIVVPMALTLGYGFLTIQLEETSILDFFKRATRFFITSQQFYVWKERKNI